MTMTEAREFLQNNLEKVAAVYAYAFGDTTGMPNPRVESVNGDEILISCHYDNFDDYDQERVCSWNFNVYVTDLPDMIIVY